MKSVQLQNTATTTSDGNVQVELQNTASNSLDDNEQESSIENVNADLAIVLPKCRCKKGT